MKVLMSMGARLGLAGLVVVAFLVGAQVANLNLPAVTRVAASSNSCGGTQNDYYNNGSTGQSAGHYDHARDGYCYAGGGWYYSELAFDTRTCFGSSCPGNPVTYQAGNLTVYDCWNNVIFNQGGTSYGTAFWYENSSNGGQYWNCGSDQSHWHNHLDNSYDWEGWGNQP